MQLKRMKRQLNETMEVSAGQFREIKRLEQQLEASRGSNSEQRRRVMELERIKGLSAHVRKGEGGRIDWRVGRSEISHSIGVVPHGNGPAVRYSLESSAPLRRRPAFHTPITPTPRLTHLDFVR